MTKSRRRKLSVQAPESTSMRNVCTRSGWEIRGVHMSLVNEAHRHPPVYQGRNDPSPFIYRDAVFSTGIRRCRSLLRISHFSIVIVCFLLFFLYPLGILPPQCRSESGLIHSPLHIISIQSPASNPEHLQSASKQYLSSQ